MHKFVKYSWKSFLSSVFFQIIFFCYQSLKRFILNSHYIHAFGDRKNVIKWKNFHLCVSSENGILKIVKIFAFVCFFLSFIFSKAFHSIIWKKKSKQSDCSLLSYRDKSGIIFTKKTYFSIWTTISRLEKLNLASFQSGGSFYKPFYVFDRFKLREATDLHKFGLVGKGLSRRWFLSYFGP
jgi:hypothetical protein